MDREAFEALYMQALPSLYRVAMSILRHQADAQDALQEAAARAWAHAEQIRPDSGKAYLMRAVINECRNIQRRRQRVTPVEPTLLPEQAAPARENDLAEALAQLPEKLRLPLLLKYMEGCSEREAARALGVTTAAVKSRLLRGRRALAAILKEELIWS